MIMLSICAMIMLSIVYQNYVCSLSCFQKSNEMELYASSGLPAVVIRNYTDTVQLL